MPDGKQGMNERPVDSKLRALLRLAADGDAEAWRSVVESFAPRVFGLIAKHCRDRDLAEEITQTTFVAVVTHIDRYDEQGRFEPWLFRIAMNQLRDEMRRRGRQAKTVASEEQDLSQHVRTDERDDPLETLDRAEQVQLLRQAIEKLPEADRELLQMRHTAGLSFAEIAEALGQPLGTVLARGHRALAKLKKLMVEDGEA